MRPVLASASPARLSVLRAAGIDPEVRVSGVDEDAVTASLEAPEPGDLVTALARAKAEAVAGEIGGEFPDAVLIGCDSMLLTEGPDGPEIAGKPATSEVAAERWKAMAGGTGKLLTGHAVMLLRDGAVRERTAEYLSTTVRFGTPDQQELDAYIATGEPLKVAGGFTLDGYGGWFVEGVDGDPSSVLGISLPLTRRLLGRIGVELTSLWRTQG